MNEQEKDLNHEASSLNHSYQQSPPPPINPHRKRLDKIVPSIRLKDPIDKVYETHRKYENSELAALVAKGKAAAIEREQYQAKRAEMIAKGLIDPNAPEKEYKLPEKFFDSPEPHELEPHELVKVNLDSMLEVQTANTWMRRASRRPQQQPLFKNLWHTGELACLFSDSNTGKSVLAVQIAHDLAAKGRKVVYYDAEMSEEQFLSRYRDEQTGVMYEFPPTLYTVRTSRTFSGNPDTSAEYIIGQIERIMRFTEADDLIIDNLTAICENSHKAEEAALFIRLLKKIKDDNRWNVLVVAHTPKRDLGQVITQNDLGGSKLLFNFFDSVFALGLSRMVPQLRYLKQLKCRIGKVVYHEDNVLTCCIVKGDDAFLRFEFGSCDSERYHISEPAGKSDPIMLKASELLRQGATIDSVAKETGLARARVGRLRLKMKESGELTKEPSSLLDAE